MIRGKGIAQAKAILTHEVKKASGPIHDLLDSAVANAAHNHKIAIDNLFVKEIRVDQGYVLKRSLPMARGSAFPMKKKTSHVRIVLAEKGESGAAPKKVKEAAGESTVAKNAPVAAQKPRATKSVKKAH